MRIRQLAAVYFLLVSTLTACGDDNDTATNRAPVLDSVDAPSSVTAADGLYTVAVTLLWSDPDGDAIAKVRYQIPAAKIDRSNDAPGAAAVGAKLAIIAADSLPKQSYDIVFTVFDAKGLESAPVTKTVSFE